VSRKIKRRWKPRLTPSAIGLIAANLLPLYGVIFLGWDVFPLILLYWLENAVIGIVNVVKMAFSASSGPLRIPQKLFLIPFFCVHYGGFLFGHGVFVFHLFGREGGGGDALPSIERILAIVAENGLTFAVLGLAGGHLFSLVHNFFIKGERKKLLLVELMFAPYGRVVVLHVFIIFGGLLMQTLNSPAAGMVLLVVLKTISDLIAHDQSHQEKASRMRNRIVGMYEAAKRDKKSDEADPLATELPGYRRDTAAEKKAGMGAHVGCFGGIAILVLGIILAKTVHGLFAVGGFVAGIAIVITGSVIHARRKRVRCPRCRRDMDHAETDLDPHALSVPEKMQCYIGPEGETLIYLEDDESPSVTRRLQRWFICRRCRLYFLGVARADKTVASGSAASWKVLSNTTRLIQPDNPADDETGPAE